MKDAWRDIIHFHEEILALPLMLNVRMTWLLFLSPVCSYFYKGEDPRQALWWAAADSLPQSQGAHKGGVGTVVNPKPSVTQAQYGLFR